jgi:hypothetical protein
MGSVFPACADAGDRQQQHLADISTCALFVWMDNTAGNDAWDRGQREEQQGKTAQTQVCA